MTKKIILLFVLLSNCLFADALSSTKPAIKKIVKTDIPINIRVTVQFEMQRAQKLSLDVFNTKKENFFHTSSYPTGKKHVFNVPVQKGTYIIALHTKDPQWYHTPVKLSVEKVKSYYEIEPNNSFKSSTPLYEKKLIKGYIQSKRKDADKDFFKLITRKEANLTLTLTHKPSNKARYTIKVFDKRKNLQLEFKSEFNKNSTTKFLPLEAGLYYVNVSSDDKILNNDEYKLTYVLNKLQEK